MPSHRQLIVQANPSARALGSSDTESAQASYPSSPIYSGEMTDDSVREFFQQQVIIGDIDDGGHTFGIFNPNYSDAPNLAEVSVDIDGRPLSSPYAPSLTSPPGGVDDWANQPATPEKTLEAGLASSAPFVGNGLASPSDTAVVISGQTLGSLRKGTSTPGSATGT
jgi:hypothetical protein